MATLETFYSEIQFEDYTNQLDQAGINYIIQFGDEGDWQVLSEHRLPPRIIYEFFRTRQELDEAIKINNDLKIEYNIQPCNKGWLIGCDVNQGMTIFE